jgi:hypothetical protein
MNKLVRIRDGVHFEGDTSAEEFKCLIIPEEAKMLRDMAGVSGYWEANGNEAILVRPWDRDLVVKLNLRHCQRYSQSSFYPANAQLPEHIQDTARKLPQLPWDKVILLYDTISASECAFFVFVHLTILVHVNTEQISPELSIYSKQTNLKGQSHVA